MFGYNMCLVSQSVISTIMCMKGRSYSMSKNKSNYGGFRSRLGILGELFSFLWKRKLWWLMPMIVVLVLFMILFVAAQATGVGPFIYTLW